MDFFSFFEQLNKKVEQMFDFANICIDRFFFFFLPILMIPFIVLGVILDSPLYGRIMGRAEQLCRCFSHSLDQHDSIDSYILASQQDLLLLRYRQKMEAVCRQMVQHRIQHSSRFLRIGLSVYIRRQSSCISHTFNHDSCLDNRLHRNIQEDDF